MIYKQHSQPLELILKQESESQAWYDYSFSEQDNIFTSLRLFTRKYIY